MNCALTCQLTKKGATVPYVSMPYEPTLKYCHGNFSPKCHYDEFLYLSDFKIAFLAIN